MSHLKLFELSVAACWVSACTQDVDPAWQLDHDRVIAVQITPNRIGAGEQATVAALLGRKALPPIEGSPSTVEVVSPTSLAEALRGPEPQWTIATPSQAMLDSARDELGLAAGEPVPLQLRMTFAPNGLVARKIVWLGEHADNPVVGAVFVDGIDRSSAASVMVAPHVDVALAVDFDDHFNINWLTSCGTMHDFDLANAYLRVEPGDPTSGVLGVVVRDDAGGVAWRLWPIAAE